MLGGDDKAVPQRRRRPDVLQQGAVGVLADQGVGVGISSIIKGGDTMKKLLDSANEYLRQSDCRDIAVLKFCLLSLWAAL